MDDLTRRAALQAAAGATLLAVGGPAEAAADDATKKPGPTDRDFVLAAGMTEAEADCWAAVAKAAGLFFELPQLHPMDKQEVATAVHVIQNKLLSRPTYRKYLEDARKARPK
jgi:hypothetical protein